MINLMNLPIHSAIRGLDGKLKIHKFRIDGTVRADDSQNILKEFMSCQAVDSLLEVIYEVLFLIFWQ